MRIPESELIINNDGTIFHLHMRPEQLADKVILVGDPARVEMVAGRLDNVECSTKNREFCSVTGQYANKRITVVSTGIGCDNIDIVMNELDALANIDFATREVKDRLKTLEICRIGTCGGLQPDTPEGTFVASAMSIGLDGLLNFYAARNEVCRADIEQAFVQHMGWKGNLCMAHPYIVAASDELLQRIAYDMKQGFTLCCGGFYAPQGRHMRMAPADGEQNAKLGTFEWEGMTINNIEMESSALAGLARIMGHRAMTCCMVVANRYAGKANTEYKASMQQLIETVLQRI